MSTDYDRLLDIPEIRRLTVADGQLALVTVTHEHADKVSIERHRLGTSIDVDDLLERIGGFGLPGLLSPAVGGVQVTEIAPLQLPQPALPLDAVSTVGGYTCSHCGKAYQTPQGLGSHVSRVHKPKQEPPTPKVPQPAPSKKPAAVSPSVAILPDEPPVSVVPLQTDGICDVCRHALGFHERCGDCAALLGPEHDAGQAADMVNNLPLCTVCVGYRETAAQLGIAA